uniref:Uncharacterized protein n=1 Tax=Arundo donax TaxID=35708 RepID=A0A0A9EWV9_ARUDO
MGSVRLRLSSCIELLYNYSCYTEHALRCAACTKGTKIQAASGQPHQNDGTTP